MIVRSCEDDGMLVPEVMLGPATFTKVAEAIETPNVVCGLASGLMS